MDKNDFFLYLEKPCRFRLKSGKEVYGVVWEDTAKNNEPLLFFASSDEFYHRHSKLNTTEIGLPIDLNDIVAVEVLSGLIPGKDMFLKQA
jgi:hypothetical protein